MVAVRGKVVRTGRELAAALTAIGKEFEGDLDEVIQKLTLDGFREILRRTPIKTGFLSSRWAVEINAHYPTNLVKNPGGSFSPAPVPNPAMFQWGDNIYIYNNTEYAWHIEHGTQNMRAQPMVEPTYLFLENETNRLLKHLSKKKVS